MGYFEDTPHMIVDLTMCQHDAAILCGLIAGEVMRRRPDYLPPPPDFPQALEECDTDQLLHIAGNLTDMMLRATLLDAIERMGNDAPIPFTVAPDPASWPDHTAN